MSLRVAEINKASAGRGLCSAGIHVARSLNIKAGEIVEIVGKKSTTGIFFPNSEDEGKQIIRIDGLVRLNAGTGLGEIVKVKKAKPEQARRVVVAPTNTKVALQPRMIRDSLINRPVVKGDNISLMNMTIPSDRPEIESDDDMMENLQNIFRDFGGHRKRTYTLGELRLVVIETQPEGFVQINPNTNVELQEGAVKSIDYVSKIDVAHLLVGHLKCGFLQGHTFLVKVKLTGELDSKGVVINTIDAKRDIKEEIALLDHTMLLPAASPDMAITERGDQVEIDCEGKHYSIPKGDVVLLPLTAITAKLLASHLHARIKVRFPGVEVWVRVEEKYSPSEGASV
jgi:6-pyruvoyl-tetrahydropterin synthase